jgi:hypothetical protein
MVNQQEMTTKRAAELHRNNITSQNYYFKFPTPSLPSSNTVNDIHLPSCISFHSI